MIYRFLKPQNFFKGILSTYKGTFKEMFVPENENEKYCYVELTEKQSIDFINHFGSTEIKLVKNADEYPGNIQSMKNNRIQNFIRVEAPQNFR
jgi:hypothetical protein